MNTQNPFFVFKEKEIRDFSELCQKLYFHFAEQNTAVMIDDSYYAYAILGISVGTEQIDLLIADPQTDQAKDAAYIVSLDLEGKYLKNSLENEKNQF